MAKDNDGLLISAGLNIQPTLENIRDDIQKLNVLLKKDKDTRARIVGGLNIAETTRLINANLATVSKGLKLDIGNVGIGNITGGLTSNLNNIVGNVQEKVRDINSTKIAPQVDLESIKRMSDIFTSEFNIKKLTSEQQTQLNTLLQNYKAAFEGGIASSIAEARKNLTSFAQENTRTWKDNSALKQYTDQYNFLNRTLHITKQSWQALKDAFGDWESMRSSLTKVFGHGNYSSKGNMGIDQILYGHGQLDSVHPADEMKRIIEECVRLKEEAKSTKSIFDMLDNVGLNEIFNAINRVSNASKQVSQTVSEAFKSIIAPISDANNQIRIAYSTYDTLANRFGSAELNQILDSWAGGSKNWSIDTTGLNATLKTVGQFEQVLNQLTATEKNLSAVTNNSASSVGNLSSSLNQIGSASNSLNGVATRIAQTNDAVIVAENSFRGLGEATSVAHYSFEDGKKKLKSFEVEVKSANGLIEKFEYRLKNIGDNQNPILVFDLKDIERANKGVQRLSDAMAKTKSQYEAKLSTFKSSNSGILSGLVNEIKAVEVALATLGNGGTISDVEKRFNNLTSVASNIKRNLDTTSSSFNVVTNADNTLRQMENTLLELSNSFSTLKTKPKEVATSIKALSNEFQQLNEFEAQNGRNEVWSEKYRQFIISVKEAQNQAKLLHQEEKANKSEAKLQAHYYNKMFSEMAQINKLKKMLATAGAEETKELKRQISNLGDRIRRDKNQIAVRKLSNTELEQERRNLEAVYQNEEKIRKTKSADKANQQRAQEAEQLQNSVANCKTQLDRLSANWQNQGVLVGNVKKRVDELFASLSKVGNAGDLSKFHTDLETLKNDVSSINAMSKNLKGGIKELQALSGNTTFKKNAGNANVQNAVTQFNELQAKYQQFQQALSTAKSPEEIRKIGAEIAGIKPQFDSVVASAKNLQASLKDTNGIDAHKQKVRVLISQIEQYMAVNTKAMKSGKLISTGNTVSVELNNMMAALRSCSSPEEYQKIASNFRIVRNEVKRLGIEGKTLWGSLKANAMKFGQWMGVTTFMTRIGMYFRQTLTTIKEVDTELTEISKAANVAREDLEELGLSAYDAASKYGKLATDYLKGIKEMTRAGFEGQASEEMAELSVLAQAAGDMTAELGNSYLIATNAAYKLKGNIEKLNTVLDGQNYVTNHNALNMTELAEATKIAGSQAESSGVQVDELTAAVGTMIAVTQQGGDQAGRAFKAILMNLRQVKAEADEIGDGGDAITSESLTKYEKACADLGVSLKEVKDGIWVLRDPMEILNDLAAAYTKEAENSVKAANLINSVGGSTYLYVQKCA